MSLMKSNGRYKGSLDQCPLTYALEIIGGKWRLPIIWALSKNGTMRYNELAREIKGITNMMLTQSLRDLEVNGILTREQFMEIPPRVEYSLSESGNRLIPALKALASWGREQSEIKDTEVDTDV
jgi:DNA-binding HxlR family transcriptional regulator